MCSSIVRLDQTIPWGVVQSVLWMPSQFAMLVNYGDIAIVTFESVDGILCCNNLQWLNPTGSAFAKSYFLSFFIFFADVRFLFVILSLPTLLILNFHLCEGKRMNSSPNAVKSSGILQFSLNKHINGILISHCRFQFRIHSLEWNLENP